MLIVVDDESADRPLGILNVDVRAYSDFLALQGSDEAFADRIIGWRSRPAEALADVVLGENVLISR
jgi:hypothetical protein